MTDATLAAASATLSSLGSALSLCPIPALQYIPTAAVAIINIAQTVKKNKEDAEALALYIGNLSVAIWRPLQNDQFRLKIEQEQQLDLLIQEVERVKKSMQKLASRNLLKRIFTSATEQIQLAGFQSRIKSVLDVFQLEGNLALRVQVDRVETVANDIQNSLKDDGLQYLIDKLGTGDYGAADVAMDNKDRACTRGTRVKLLQLTRDWIAGFTLQEKQILWVKGVAGSGKSTVAATVEIELAAFKRLGGAFAFSRTNPDRNKRAILELARQLSYWKGGVLRAQIAEAVKNESSISYLTPADQFEKLIRQPLQSLSETTQPLVFVLDAMDEADEDFAAKLLELIGIAHAELPPSIKFLITSRVEPHLQLELESESMQSTVEHYALDEEELAVVKKDVEAFLRERLPQLAKLYGVKEAGWPGKDKLEALADMSEGSFIWAATAALFIADRNSRNPRGQLDLLFQTLPGLPKLDALYASILDRSFPVDIDPYILTLLQAVLGTLVVTQTLLDIHLLITLVSLDTTDIQINAERVQVAVLDRLQSVLTVSGSHSGSDDGTRTIHFLHTSFVDFITDPLRCPPRFLVNRADHHERMAKACFLSMQGLKRNICDLKDPSKLNSEVDGLKELVKIYVARSLRYACHYWPAHLACTPPRSMAIQLLFKEFLESRLLFWVEVLSLLGLVHDAIPMIGAVLQWLATCGDHAESSLAQQELLDDVRHFLYEFMEPICTSALHVYLSALPCVPLQTALARVYGHMMTGGLRVLRGLEQRWSQTVWVGRRHTEPVRCLAFSPDGSTVASGSDDGIIWLWDAKTGASIGEALLGHSNQVRCLTFSPDGATLASGSWDSTLRLWDVQTGAPIGEALEGHSSDVTCLAISPNGNTLASGSEDNTLRLWAVKTGTSIQQPLKGHSSRVNCLAFSPDGATLASGSDDNTLLLWDMTAGAFIRKALRGHSNSVNCLAFSPDSTTLASGSDDNTLRLWDAKTGASIEEALRGHSDTVTCLAFSPNSTSLASGSFDNTLRLWNAKTGTSLGDALEGHSSDVDCVAFSPDGATLASGSDDNTLRLWNATLDEPISTVVEGHSYSVTCLAFSPNGTILASGSLDKTLRLWDVRIDVSIDEVLDAHSNVVSCLAFSPDGATLASGSYDGTLRLWDAKTGASIGVALEPPSGGVESLAFLQHGETLALETEGGEILDVANRKWITNLAEHLVGANPAVHAPSYHPFVIDILGWLRTRAGSRLVWLPPRFRPLRDHWEEEYDENMLHAFGNTLSVQIPLLPILDISAFM